MDSAINGKQKQREPDLRGVEAKGVKDALSTKEWAKCHKAKTNRVDERDDTPDLQEDTGEVQDSFETNEHEDFANVELMAEVYERVTPAVQAI